MMIHCYKVNTKILRVEKYLLLGNFILLNSNVKALADGFENISEKITCTEFCTLTFAYRIAKLVFINISLVYDVIGDGYPLATVSQDILPKSGLVIPSIGEYSKTVRGGIYVYPDGSIKIWGGNLTSNISVSSFTMIIYESI